MTSYYLALDLPPSIQLSLASLCYGLPQVQWVEENSFHLNLRFLGNLSLPQVEEVQQRFSSLFFSPFELTLQGVGHFHAKNRGMVWAGALATPSLLKLKKEVDKALKGLSLPSEPAFQPVVILGYYERLHADRLQDYLMNHAGYQSAPIEITSCSLLCRHTTAKRVFYEVIEQYEASPAATGED